MKRPILYSMLGVSLAILALPAIADRSKYVDAGPVGSNFIYNIPNWSPGQKWSEDDNFFISRVKPKARFRNQATQIIDSLDDSTDKNLIYWVPIGTPPLNGLPIGQYDGDVFNMWQYVTHYGNWSAGLNRCPGNFSDVAHKNGVGVSTIIATPYGLLSQGWADALTAMVNQDPALWSQYMKYYGLDGIGYNSEFQYPSPRPEGMPEDLVKRLADFNAALMRMADTKSPAYANIWYDGTDINGKIHFDAGLDSHNFDTFGRGDNPASALFLNYNWNRLNLEYTVNNARAIGRNPLDIYCGFNMQGKEPSPRNAVWTLMQKYPLSIGLWGAHSENIMFESRNEKGSSDDAKQATYMQRNELFFSGGSRNPITRPEITDNWGCGAENTDFFGMAALMSARSPLCWDLSSEPFITHFNLGNGKFFNWNGKLADKAEWCNIGVQDYMPTWRWWLAKNFLGKSANDAAKNGLDVNFTWTDAYLGGSLMNVAGNTAQEYLHLFKTRFNLQAGDKISLTYRLVKGDAQLRLALSAEGSESTAVESAQILQYGDADQKWHTATFTVGEDFPALVGKNLAMIALKFNWANGLDLNIGGFSVYRPGAASATPATPVIERAEALDFTKEGVDAKLIYNMPNSVQGRVCYNDDVNTSMFKIYYQQEGEEVHLKTITTSWAALVYSAALNPAGSAKVRFGVSALSIDRNSESEIAWSEYFDCSALHQPDFDLMLSNDEPFVDEPFEILTVDPYTHENMHFIITDQKGQKVMEGDGESFVLENGLPQAGTYGVSISKDGMTRDFPGFIQILDQSIARAPKIENIAFEAKDAFDNPEQTMQAGDHDLLAGQHFEYSYTGRKADGIRSRGLHLDGFGFGIKSKDAGFDNKHPFSLSFWLCPDNLNTSVQLVSLRDKTNTWPRNEFGMFRQVYDPVNRRLTTAIIFKAIIEGTYEIVYDNVDIPNNGWTHFGYSFDFDSNRCVTFKMAVNGKVLTPTSWRLDSEQGEGDPVALGPTPVMTQYHVLAVGGALHKTGGVEGYVDQVHYFDKALSDEELTDCYLANGLYNPDESLKLYFNFDNEALDDYTFESAIKSGNQARGGLVQYVADFDEGTGTARWAKPSFGPGAPCSTVGRDVKTTAVWTIPGANITEQIDGDAEGSARGSFFKCGSFKATLTLTNDCGSDSREYEFVNVGAGVHVNAIPEQNGGVIDSYTFQGNELLIWLSGEDSYNAKIFSTDGMLVSTAQSMSAQNVPAAIRFDAPAGYYLLTLTNSEGETFSLKIHKK